MKKKYYDYFTYSCYKYAPESFKLFFKNKLVKLSKEQSDRLGYIAITKGSTETLKAIKEIFRKSGTFAPLKNTRKILAIRTNEGNGTYIKIQNNYGYGIVNIYDISEKLRVFKDLKKAYNNDSFNINLTVGKMEIYGQFEKGENVEIEKPKLLKRIVFV